MVVDQAHTLVNVRVVASVSLAIIAGLILDAILNRAKFALVVALVTTWAVTLAITILELVVGAGSFELSIDSEGSDQADHCGFHDSHAQRGEVV